MKRLPVLVPRAFTLMEMLIATAITLILAALLVPTVGKVRGQAGAAQCVSNLRQLGMAINLFANDNDDRLPGPVGTGLGRELKSGLGTQMLTHLQPYLDLPTPTANPVYPKILQCPGLTKDTLGTQSNWYDVTLYAGYSNNDLPAARRYLRDRSAVDANGNLWSVGPWGRSNMTPASPGWKRAWLSDSIDETKTLPDGSRPTLATIPAIREIDATMKSWPWPVPTKAVHGTFHNVLYFDWHVERAPRNAFQ